jgi:glycosyltransferase involved in cell wall biosynthesis
MKPLLSIVTATYSRLDFLRAFIQSVRDQIPPSFEVEYIIVDGGSKDGTEAWASAQPNALFIQQGQLLGAIAAFNAGCAAASGEYVFLGNDDVVVLAGSMIRALAYLDSHPHCGAVAFADDRRASNKPEGYGVQYLSALTPSGEPTRVVYAQCGLFRKWLGDRVNWWDIGVSDQHTYGGDSALSAKIWELGYTVDAVEGVSVHDRIAPDSLRERNHQIEQRIGSAYYRRYPNGVQISSAEKIPPQTKEHLRIFYAPLFSEGYGRYKRGLCDALSRVGLVYELDYLAYPERFARTVADFQPHLILTQFHGADVITPETLAEARTYAPHAVVVNWNGDVYADQLTAPDMLRLLRHVDLQLVVNADVLPVYAVEGIRAAYWQIGFEPVPDTLPYAPAHDLLFMANAYSERRRELAMVLRELAGNVGLYGYGWDAPSGNTFYNFAQGAALYRNCAIAIGDNQWDDRGFVSNRLFEALANGAFLLHQAIPGLEELTGLRDGVHYVAWRDHDDLRAKVRHYLRLREQREQIARQGEAFVRKAHSFDARVRELFIDLLPKARHFSGRAEPVAGATPVLIEEDPTIEYQFP